MQRAPYDFLVEDEALSAVELARARLEDAAWTDEHVYALLPYSFCVLESLTEEQVRITMCECFGQFRNKPKSNKHVYAATHYFCVLEALTKAQVSVVGVEQIFD